MTQIGMTRPQASPRQCAWKNAAVYGLLAAIVLFPIAMVSVPSLEDYPNHLARMHILSHYNDSESLRQFYEVRWRPIPYLGMDATFVLLSRIASIYDGGRIFVGLCVLLPVISVAALHYSIHRRFSLVPTAAFLLSYNAPLLWGFLNYLPVLCLAVIVFAGWIATAHWARARRLIVFSLLTTLLYLGHLVAFGAYCLMVLCFEAFRAGKVEPRAWREVIVDLVFAALQAIPAIILAMSVAVEKPFVGPVETNYGGIIDKLEMILSPILFLQTKPEICFGIIAIVTLILGRFTGRLKLQPELFQIFLVVGVFSLCVPLRLLGIFGMDFRLPLLAAMLLLSAISTTNRAGPFFRNTILCGVILLTAVRSALISSELGRVDEQIAQLRQVISTMPKGMRLLTIEVSGTANLKRFASIHVSYHAPLVAVIDRDAFAPTLFTGVTTVKPAPALKASSTPAGYPFPDLDQFLDGYGRADPIEDIPTGRGGRIYWYGWERKFDYVLVMHYGERPTALPAILQLVASSEVADLYSIVKLEEFPPH
jgi:hypothetical protein